MAKGTSVVQVDLSHLPKAVQNAVGPDLALSVARNMRLATKPVVVGRLGPGIYGYILPDAVLSRQIAALAKKGR